MTGTDHAEAVAQGLESLAQYIRELLPDPIPSWVAGWEDLDAFQREVDSRIGEAVAAHVRREVVQAIAAARNALEPGRRRLPHAIRMPAEALEAKKDGTTYAMDLAERGPEDTATSSKRRKK